MLKFGDASYIHGHTDLRKVRVVIETAAPEVDALPSMIGLRSGALAEYGCDARLTRYKYDDGSYMRGARSRSHSRAKRVRR